MSQLSQALTDFQWKRQPETEALVREFLDEFLRQNTFAAQLAHRMREETGTRFHDWVDSIHIPREDPLRARLENAGFTPDPAYEHGRILRNEHGIFPLMALQTLASEHNVFLKVDSVVDFLGAQEIPWTADKIRGQPFAPWRFAAVAGGEKAGLWVMERRGLAYNDFGPADATKRLAAAEHFERFRLRRRHLKQGHAGYLDSEEDGFKHAHFLADAAIADLGVDQTCALFFAAEREYWQRRNRAAQVQKARQDRLGLGWGNHDHHTYRSSRQHFARLVAFHEKLGLVCRERFYAGREAGWGAQVMENPRAGIVTFNDVDLAPEELLEDFAHQPLVPRNSLGTVGLWCGLHGEAFLQAGMHHLECQFDFAALKQQLQSHHGIGVMKPFTDFPYLRQAFTEGERWPVAEERLQKLLDAHLITNEQAEKFRREGAIGSHLENLERNEGFKGFNQKGVSEIIAATDPRLQNPQR